MPNTINFFDSYYMAGAVQEIERVPSFFRDRYFPTDPAVDIFAADKVLCEYMDADRKLAPFVAQRVGDIPLNRMGYQVHEYTPAYIGISRPLSIDDLKKRGFGEALYANSTEAERAQRLQLRDFADLERRIARREEWLCAQTMINNGCTMVEYIDAQTVGETNSVYFYDTSGSNPSVYTVANEWNGQSGDFMGDVKAMCRMLSSRGLPVADLVLGVEVADEIQQLNMVQQLLNKESGIVIGKIEEELSAYPGVTFLGRLNFGGHKLNLISVDETYVDDNGSEQSYFPGDSAMVTAPACGHLMYAQITHIEHGGTDFVTFAQPRVPKLIVDEKADMRSLRLASRPLAAPLNKAPWIYAANVLA